MATAERFRPERVGFPLALLLLPYLGSLASRRRSVLCHCPCLYTQSREPHRRSRRALRRRAPCCSRDPGPIVGWLRALSCGLAHSSLAYAPPLICLMYALCGLLQTRCKPLRFYRLGRDPTGLRPSLVLSATASVAGVVSQHRERQ